MKNKYLVRVVLVVVVVVVIAAAVFASPLDSTGAAALTNRGDKLSIPETSGTLSRDLTIRTGKDKLELITLDLFKLDTDLGSLLIKGGNLTPIITTKQLRLDIGLQGLKELSTKADLGLLALTLDRLHEQILL